MIDGILLDTKTLYFKWFLLTKQSLMIKRYKRFMKCL